MKQFRLQAKKLFITYSQVTTNITKEEILRQLQLKMEIENYIIAKEYHQDRGVHFHVVVELTRRCDIRNTHYLDIEYEGKIYHGNYKTAKNIRSLIVYVTKDRDYISSWDIDTKTGKILTLEKKLALMTTTNGLDNTLRYYITNHRLELDKYSRIESNLKRLDKQITKLNQRKSLYHINTFEPQIMIDTALKDRKHSTWISGPSGTRKTSYVEARVNADRDDKLITDYVFIRHLDQLKQFDPEIHQLIILDDCALPNDREALISLFDIERPSAVNVKHDVITIPANVKRVFISNQTFNEMLYVRNLLNDKALIRRIKEIKVNDVIRIKDESLQLN